ncbi:S1C family serine protease [Deinococcus sonorensis]|uniref:Trypsin-like peptidase domain-containing protein n=2 Tax=Deinococcus sonorensis TaxID=309891 RepID=A0AAU7UDS1_9DEIO
MNAARALTVLSVAVLMSVSALAQTSSTPQSAQRARPDTAASKDRSTPTPVLPAALQSVFQKTRPASLELLACQNVVCAEPDGIGSGVLISADGSVLTAYHVVYDSKLLVAVTLDKKRYPVTVVGFDEAHDLALLKINIQNAPFVPLAAQPPKVGQPALAIGNAGGNFLLPKSGQLLGLDTGSERADFPSGTLKMSAPLMPGDSGGPILNSEGQLIGITSYISVEGSMQQPNITSYAVPVSQGSSLLSDLKSGVKREAPVVGVDASGLPDGTLPASVLQDLGLGSTVGFLFTGVVAGGPADKAGLHPLTPTAFDKNRVPTHATADVITAVDGQRVQNYIEFLNAVRGHQVGERVTLTVIRNGNSTPLKIPVTLAPRTILLSSQSR